ncbi:HelD family protein [Actinocrispum wychmicini]|nr:ATP-binding domain-containing protein [Actinocrispum wychmicini]
MRAEAVARMAGGGPDTAAVWRAEVSRLDAMQPGLYFGRLDMADGRRVHIGRLGLFHDGADEPLLLDWRAPAARPFYTATAAAADGVRRRRRITTRGRMVVALNDELLDLDGTGDGLVGEAALLAAVTAERTGRMRDIVTTLQVEQDRIIRDSYQGVLVVQGGPGTGKTAVALHRAAYLLYTHPHLRTRGVLVVGPSQVFLDYIGQVLPGLGEHSVVTATIADLCPGVRVSRVDPPEIAERKGRADMAGWLADTVRARVRIPDEPVEIEFEQQVLALDPDSCRRAVRAARVTGLPHNQARLVFHSHIVDALAQLMIDRTEAIVLTETGEAIDGGSPDGSLGDADLRMLAAAGVVVDDIGPRDLLAETDRADLRTALLAEPGVEVALDALWPPLTAEEVVADLVGTDGWSVADVPLLDEAAAIVGSADGRATFGHVVVDEAQELSEMDWRMVARRCPTRSMTVVGDLAQTGSAAGASSWDRVGDHRLAQLTVNYRTPTEIMAATADLLAARHPGLTPPRSVRSAGETPRRTWAADLCRAAAEFAAAHVAGQLAVIAPGTHIGPLAAALSVAVPPDLTEKVVLLTPAQAKGLEFDVVLIVDPAAILATGPRGHSDLYVAMTRATQRLRVVHPGAVPAELAAIPS